MAGRKRPRGEDVTEEFFRGQDKSGSYLKLSLTDDRPLKAKGWPWVQMALRKILGTDKLDKASFLRDGSLLVKTKNAKQTETLLSVDNLMGETCHVIRDKRLNSSKGTVHSYDLEDLSETELVEWLADFGVIEAKRFTKKINGKVVQTPTVLLTFDSPSCPERLQLDYITYTVKKHVPNPLMCFNCGIFGHPEGTCSNKKRCLNCGEHDHVGACDRKCLNCGDPGHSCRSRDCPRWIKEKAICKLKVELEVSYAEAKRQYEASQQPPLLQPYSAIVRLPSNNQRQEEQSLREKVENLEKKLEEKLGEMTVLLTKLVQCMSPTTRDVEKQSETETSEVSSNKTGAVKVTEQVTNKGKVNDAAKGPPLKPKPVKDKPATKPVKNRTEPHKAKDVDMTSVSIVGGTDSEESSQIVSRRSRSSSRDGQFQAPQPPGRRSWIE